MINGVYQQALCVSNEVFKRQNFLRVEKRRGMGCIVRFSDGPDSFFLNELHFLYIFGRCTAVLRESVQ